MIRRSRPALTLIAVLTALITVAGCAAIPDETPAAGLAAGGAGDRVAPAPDPQPNLQPADLVRAFLDANADPTNSYAAGRPYLTKAAQAKWQPDAPVTIIQNTFNTLPEQTKADHATVTVISQTVGVLGTDKAFVPSSAPSTLIVQVDKQDGQWRISQPPSGVVMTLDRFNEVYRQTRLYFLDPQKRVLVPDLRYIVSQPSYSLPSRVIDLLLAGPSNGMQGAVTSALGAQAALQTGGTESGDGALLVNLSHVGDTSPANVKLIIAQVVQSLAVVTNSRIRIQQDGVQLSPDRLDWRIGDLPAYDSGTSPGPDQTGLLVHDGRVKQLDDKPVNGPAGNGGYYVSTAAQSIDGSELATVSKPPGTSAAELRVGGLTQVNPVVDLTAGTLTRPTWVSTDSATDVSNEVWTVADGSRVARVIKSADGTWVARTVNSNDLSQFGQITDLRLSRDGTRAAVIANSLLIVCAVVRTPNSDTVTLRSPRVLLQDTLNSVVGVDWLLQDQLVVATSSQESPVVQVSVDGSPTFVRYNAANLTAPVSAVTAAPSRPVIVVDAGGMWTSSDSGSVWRVQGIAVGKSSNAVPFYPG
ncbi:LpqB family beta-propeller domain-containing protein [Kutzneria buriramensis]|uniref:Lipoprotein LpqB-like beta-propeller protein n=1 Tax=Kutzneria buriramensis TaxID=1045776 RepID=A0A3E0ICC3_9PSEU|nr:LpqB family beta-propeller domain-containing protein [Kutzneria buriramensis]REH55825.1 lipoprotein LpqB-like beta-propeller protein [Kutzneria buriramensis]